MWFRLPGREAGNCRGRGGPGRGVRGEIPAQRRGEGRLGWASEEAVCGMKSEASKLGSYDIGANQGVTASSKAWCTIL